jgi:glyoxylase I family protein
MSDDAKAVVPARPHSVRTGNDQPSAADRVRPLMQRRGYELLEESRTRIAWARCAPRGRCSGSS